MCVVVARTDGYATVGPNSHFTFVFGRKIMFEQKKYFLAEKKIIFANKKNHF